MKQTTTSLLATAFLFAGSAVLSAAVQEFDFKDPKGVNNVAFQLDAPLESISGNAKGISGIVRFDPENAGVISGTITVEADSLTTTNDTMQEHLHSDGWLDVAKYPQITFATKSIAGVEELDDGFKAQLTGDFTLKGVTREITVPATFTYLPDMLSARTNGAAEGDLLVIRSNFTINRSHYGIKPGQNTNKVAEEVELRLAIAGAAPDA